MADESWDSIIANAGDGFNRPPEGDYTFSVTDAVAGVGKSEPYNPNIKVSLKIAEGPEVGKAIKDYYMVKSVGGAQKFLSNLKALGIATETLMTSRPTLDQIAKVIVGKRVSGTVVHKSHPRFGDSAEIDWQLRAPDEGAFEVTEFPALSAAESLGYGSGENVAATDDAAF